MYIYQHTEWPKLHWQQGALANLLAQVRFKEGLLSGKLSSLGFDLQTEAMYDSLVLDAIKTSEIEGEQLPIEQVRLSVAKKLGLDVAGLPPSSRYTDGIVEMLVDATKQYSESLTPHSLFNWHAALFPTGRSGMQPIKVAHYRTVETGPMQVVSGAIGNERVHFEAPHADLVPAQMDEFLRWFNAATPEIDPVIKAGVAHLWFITIHPFEDGNGRIARAITDLQLAKADKSPIRFYSMSAQINIERKGYYDCLERTQQSSLDITPWLLWFLNCLHSALQLADENLQRVIHKAKFWNFLSDKTLNDRQKHMLNKLLDNFEGKLTTAKWAKLTKVSSDTALRDIQQLEAQGILIKSEAGGRSSSYELKVL